MASSVVAIADRFPCGPSHLRVEPVKVEPIHMTIDVNIHDDHAPAKPDQ